MKKEKYLKLNEAYIIYVSYNNELYLVDTKKKIGNKLFNNPYVRYQRYDLHFEDEAKELIKGPDKPLLLPLQGGSSQPLGFPEGAGLRIIKIKEFHKLFNLDLTQKEIDKSIRSIMKDSSLTNWAYKVKDRSEEMKKEIERLESIKEKIKNEIGGEEYTGVFTSTSLRVEIRSRYISLRESSNGNWYGVIRIQIPGVYGILEDVIYSNQNLDLESSISKFKGTIHKIRETLSSI